MGIPLQACLATCDDEYKKPAKGMWEFFTKEMNGKLAIDMKNSFYCGDAAGRKGPPKDFSDSDLKFAKNINL